MKKILIIICLVPALVLGMTACKSNLLTSGDITAKDVTAAEITETETETNSEPESDFETVPVTKETVSQEQTSEETTAEQEPETEQTGADISGNRPGTTRLGYEIIVENGLAYLVAENNTEILLANKTYVLPEDYNPNGGELTGACSAAFEQMRADAANDGISLWNQSGFRSYSTQESLYNNYCARDGKEAADTYSARPGHSEHQTGLAIDVNRIENAFKDSQEGKWLAEHCWEYGFILRYPEGKQSVTGYCYEPWHIRYIGSRDIAEKLYNGGSWLCLEECYGIDSFYAN